MSNDPIAWLHRELPGWVRDGILDRGQADRLSRRYPEPEGPRSHRLLSVLFAIIGSLLIGGGLLLLIAYNWPSWPRSLRAVLSIVPLAVVQAGGLWVLARRNDRAAWCESLGIAWLLSVGGSIALVAQTYHMPGSFDTFLITWMILSIPILYLMPGVSVFVLYLAGAVGWGFSQRVEHAGTAGAWLLMAAALPLAFRWHREAHSGAYAVISRWALIMASGIAAFGFIDFGHGGVWYNTTILLAASLLHLGWLYESGASSAWRRPALVMGSLFVVPMAFALSVDEVLRNVLRQGWPRDPETDLKVYAVLVSFLYTTSLVLTVRKGWQPGMIWGLLPVILAACWLLGWMEAGIGVLFLIVNAFVLAAGVVTLREGIRTSSLTRVNGGMMVIGAWILMRFFDGEYPILLRAVVFIVLGLLFLAVNLRMARTRKAART